MKRIFLIISVFLMAMQFIVSEENVNKSEDNLSRLILLDFNYFVPPFPLPDITLTNPLNQVFHFDQTRGMGVILIFLGNNDPFNSEIKREIDVLKKQYLTKPLRFMIVSEDSEDYKDLNGLSREKLGVITYPSYFIIDKNYELRGSAEGIYPSLLSDDFIKILDSLLLDIESTGIINTLK